ncbi:YbhN family protein [Streptomyces sp. TRM68367]|uniref:lysylphosphatidylglycerol synthase transmembrane domain-containing protein n=1 Tax=Streptomyces sp. TRM68367 TaxID=2758415 RepID=UPI00165ACFC2|nr:YbhN family protein [Streptomyces sp. TRM68367]MBC9723928.1 flippase-like domain-containing protein [Streptomyces sp. TRM68367]
MPRQPDLDEINGRAQEPHGARPGWAWWLGATALVTAAVLLAIGYRQELARAAQLVARVSPPKLAVALAFEAASLVCFAAVQRWLLHAGGVRLSLKSMTALAMAANAVAGALPGGAAFAAAWLYRQLRRRRAEKVLAAAVLVASGALSALALFLLLVTGALTAGLGGQGGVLRPALAMLGLAVGLSLVLLALARSARLRAAVQRAWKRAGRQARRVLRLQEALAGLTAQARSVQPGFRPWLRPFGLAVLNWTFDAACLAASLWALGIGVPWSGLLLAYALTQIPGSLRLTPGSLGVVEVSLATLLISYGLRPDQAIAATLLYRILSFWTLQPIGWATWLGLTLRARSPAPPSARGPYEGSDAPH